MKPDLASERPDLGFEKAILGEACRQVTNFSFKYFHNQILARSLTKW